MRLSSKYSSFTQINTENIQFKRQVVQEKYRNKQNNGNLEQTHKLTEFRGWTQLFFKQNYQI